MGFFSEGDTMMLLTSLILLLTATGLCTMTQSADKREDHFNAPPALNNYSEEGYSTSEDEDEDEIYLRSLQEESELNQRLKNHDDEDADYANDVLNNLKRSEADPYKTHTGELFNLIVSTYPNINRSDLLRDISMTDQIGRIEGIIKDKVEASEILFASSQQDCYFFLQRKATEIYQDVRKQCGPEVWGCVLKFYVDKQLQYILTRFPDYIKGPDLKQWEISETRFTNVIDNFIKVLSDNTFKYSFTDNQRTQVRNYIEENFRYLSNRYVNERASTTKWLESCGMRTSQTKLDFKRFSDDALLKFQSVFSLPEEKTAIKEMISTYENQMNDDKKKTSAKVSNTAQTVATPVTAAWGAASNFWSGSTPSPTTDTPKKKGWFW